MRPTERDFLALPLPKWAWPLYRILRPLRLLGTHGLTARREPAADLGVFIATPDQAIQRMLDLADLHVGDVLYDLGCGDGQIVVMAAKRFGIRAVGIDIDPHRIAGARANSRRSGVQHLVQFCKQDVCTADLSAATVVTLYLKLSGISAIAEKLRAELRPGTRVVSRDALIPGWGSPDRMECIEISSGLTTKLCVWRIPLQSSLQAVRPLYTV